jgi:hypothetical protein
MPQGAACLAFIKAPDLSPLSRVETKIKNDWGMGRQLLLPSWSAIQSQAETSFHVLYYGPTLGRINQWPNQLQWELVLAVLQCSNMVLGSVDPMAQPSPWALPAHLPLVSKWHDLTSCSREKIDPKTCFGRGERKYWEHVFP